MIAEIVYVLCGLFSILCGAMLYLKYKESHARLLLWSAVCFLGLALNNIVLFIDMIVVPQTDISALRMLAALLGVGTLIYGMVWDTA